MSQVSIILPDNSVKTFDHEPTILEVAQSIGPRLAKETLGGLVNDSREIQDLRFKLKNNDKLKIITSKDREGLDVIRHSAAHVMAQAVQELWPEVKVTIGPVIEDGFYYDFDSPFTFTPEDLEKIEKKTKEIIKQNLEITREDWDKSKAIETFSKMGETFKVELIEAIPDERVGIYKQGGKWFDLCRGPHVQNTSAIKAIKVLHQAGAYWRGDEKNKMLQRVYATAFFSEKDLQDHLNRIEEAKKRDHRKLGKEMGLFVFDQVAVGSPFFTPKGTIIYNELLNYVREMYKKYGYNEVITPQIYDVDLYHTSGHYENYRENMYFTDIDERSCSVKPMNCPGHCVLYSHDYHSYRDLPLRIADFGRLHRYEKSGALHGMTRVRSFSQDDAHIFCTQEQVQSEIERYMTMLNEIYQTLGMSDYIVKFSTRPEQRVGSDEFWDQAEGALEEALKKLNLKYELNPGDGAFYGPKLDITFFDALKRPWQLGTLQYDPNMPQRFNLKYIGSDNAEHTPIMLHRAILGSLERFIGVYTEHCAGHFPLWMHPNQVRILNLNEVHIPFCEELKEILEKENIRVHFDSRNEKLGFKIREAQLMKVPYMIIIGDKEKEARKLSVRYRTGENFNDLTIESFVEGIKKEIKERRLNSYLKKD